jgi:hypothetical protein
MNDSTRKPIYTGRRARGAILATLATLISMLLASIGAAPAQGDGVGTTSARGTAQSGVADLAGPHNVDVQYSAITNCNEAANTRPFIVNVPFFGWTFRRTSTDTSTCNTSDGSSVNVGSGAGTATGPAFSGPATLAWRFQESPDNVVIHIEADSGSEVFAFGAPQPWNGSPGGVWVFGTLPWPAA